PGTYTISVKGSTGDIGSANFVVTTPVIALFPASGPDTTIVTISGSGFALTDSACTINSSPAGLFTVSSCTIVNGKLSATTFTVAATAPLGAYQVTVKGTAAMDTASAQFIVNPFSPSITLTPSAASDGATVTITGSGFNPADTSCSTPPPTSTPLTVWAGSAPPSCVFTSPGKFTATFTVAKAGFAGGGVPPGTYTITIIGNSGGDAAEALFVVSGAPTV